VGEFDPLDQSGGIKLHPLDASHAMVSMGFRVRVAEY
jgi:hypothetical protein